MPSSVVKNILYSRKASVLRVWFVTGAVYEYRKVPARIYRSMLAAGSKGRYLNRYIKGHYTFKKIA